MTITGGRTSSACLTPFCQPGLGSRAVREEFRRPSAGSPGRQGGGKERDAVAFESVDVSDMSHRQTDVVQTLGETPAGVVVNVEADLVPVGSSDQLGTEVNAQFRS